MSDLIDRQDAIKAIEDLQDCYNGFSDTYDKACIIGALEEVPSAHPEIIRCRDCENWDKTWTNDWSPEYHYCPMIDGVRKGDFYCADAKRRES